MIALLGRPDPATAQAIQFAQGILEGSATAFYEVDGSLKLNRFVLSSDVPANFHDQYLAGMDRLDPLHPRSASNRPFARLSVAINQCATQEAATYRTFAGQCGIADMIEFFFRRNDRIVAGMSVLWVPGCKIPDGTMNIAEKIHDYLEFNLTSRLSSTTEEPARYGLTAPNRAPRRACAPRCGGCVRSIPTSSRSAENDYGWIPLSRWIFHS